MPVLNIVSWNVAGLKAFAQNHPKLLKQVCDDHDVDVLCLQETKLREDNAEKVINSLKGFEKWHKVFSCSRNRLGHSGVLTMSRKKPLTWSSSIDDAGLDREGRIVITKISGISIVNVYVMNSGPGLINISRRLDIWDPALQRVMKRLNKKGPVILTGDLNVAADDIDIHDPARHLQSPGFTPQERESFNAGFMKAGWIDTWRHLHPEQIAYTFFSKKYNNRPKNRGWRLDYFLIPRKMLRNLINSEILNDYIDASDHLPILLSYSC